MGTSTFILPAADVEMSELRSMCIYCYLFCCGKILSVVNMINSVCLCMNCVSLYELCCGSQGSGHSSAGRHPCGTPHPGLLVFQEEEWLQNNQSETITL